MTNTDPFEDPTPRVSAFASADSFRGRLILIEPTNVERNVPKQRTAPNGAKGDKVTANVTVLDGQGPVQIFNRKVPTGRFLEGPMHRGVWFNQDQITDGLQTPEGHLRKRVLCRIETLQPGVPAGEGNPWTMVVTTPAEKETALRVLNEITIGGASAPAQEEQSPF